MSSSSSQSIESKTKETPVNVQVIVTPEDPKKKKISLPKTTKKKNVFGNRRTSLIILALVVVISIGVLIPTVFLKKSKKKMYHKSYIFKVDEKDRAPGRRLNSLANGMSCEEFVKETKKVLMNTRMGSTSVIKVVELNNGCPSEHHEFDTTIQAIQGEAIIASKFSEKIQSNLKKKGIKFNNAVLEEKNGSVPTTPPGEVPAGPATGTGTTGTGTTGTAQPRPLGSDEFKKQLKAEVARRVARKAAKAAEKAEAAAAAANAAAAAANAAEAKAAQAPAQAQAQAQVNATSETLKNATKAYKAVKAREISGGKKKRKMSKKKKKEDEAKALNVVNVAEHKYREAQQQLQQLQ